MLRGHNGIAMNSLPTRLRKDHWSHLFRTRCLVCRAIDADLSTAGLIVNQTYGCRPYLPRHRNTFMRPSSVRGIIARDVRKGPLISSIEDCLVHGDWLWRSFRESLENDRGRATCCPPIHLDFSEVDEGVAA